MHNPLPSKTLFGFAALVAAGLANAASLTWDSSGANPANPVDGGGTWDTSAALWSNGGSDTSWNNAANNTAVFGNANGAAGTVDLASAVTVGGITFNAPVSGNYVLSGTTLTLAGATPTITTNVDATINAGIGGSAGLTKSGAGTLVLGGTNTYTGGTVISAGTLSFSSNSATGAGGLPTGNITLMDGATLQYTAAGSGGFNRGYVLGTGTTTISSTSSTGGLNASGNVNFTGSGARSLVLSNVSGNAMTFGGSISDGTGGTTSVIKNGAGDLNLNGTANTYTGSTIVNAGKIFANGNDRISTAGTVFLNAGAEIRLNGDQTIANLQNGSGGGGTLTRAFAGTSIATIQSGSFGGKIDDLVAGARVISVVKSTSGVLRLSGSSNNYSGGTTISAGTLLVNNPSGNGLGVGAVTVTSSTLGGNGYAALGGTNSINVGGGGVIAAGDSNVADGIGTLTFSGSATTGSILNMQAGSSFTFDLAAGNANDTVRFYNYTGASDFLRDAGGVTLNFNGAQDGTYDLFTFYSNAGTTLTSAGFTELASNFTLGSGLTNYTAAWDYSTTGVISLTLTAVPEPATAGLALASLALCLRRRRE